MQQLRQSYLARPTDRRAHPEDRRAASRYLPVARAGWLGWWIGETFVTSRAFLLDISLGGVRLLVDDRPTGAGTSCFVSLGEDWPTGWTEARVIELVTTRRGPHTARLRFEGGCPYEMFKAAVYPGGV